MELNLFLDFIGNSVKEINRDVVKLQTNQYQNAADLLDHLSSEVVMLENHIKYFTQSNHLSMEEIPDPFRHIYASEAPEEENNVRYFTLDELSQYNGENGAPAYVAVNGVVYDVTDNSVWMGGSHFGLSPGRDLTNEFETCHPGAMVLSVLPIVGYLTLV
ncbi:cytochrome b5 domain-containing protein [Lachnospiraceae bacterium 54-53]